MLKMVRYYCLLVILFFAPLSGESLSYLPVASKGRFLPLEVYAKHWLTQFYHQDQLDRKDAKAFSIADRSALSVLLDIHFNGIDPWADFPLFWIGPQAEMKALLGLEQNSSPRLSYNQLQQLKLKMGSLSPSTAEELQKLFQVMQQMEQKKTKMAPAIVKAGNHFFATLSNTDPLLKLLPSIRGDGEWVPIRAVSLQMEDAQADAIVPVPNFTLYSNEQFNLIRHEYLNKKIPADLLLESYRPLAGAIYLEVSDKAMTYPTLNQLYAEVWYYRIPWLELTISAYLISAIWILVSLIRHKGIRLSFLFFLVPVTLHAFVLGLRCYILGRPPVSNMYETIVYVPWILALASIGLYLYYRNQLILFAGALGASILLILLQFVSLNSALENVQPVLDSQYWLTVHVLLVVASYGVFALSALLSHLYLLSRTIVPRETPPLKTLAQAVLQSLYVGVAFLIIGTILGGVWAAESWGRFWDWDPKESWAFISICTYLIWIHAYTFNYVNNLGLAIGSSIGFLAISFTWYGVNYILGTGLHSYGFGSGGEIYYYLFLLADFSFLLVTGLLAKWKSRGIPSAG